MDGKILFFCICIGIGCLLTFLGFIGTVSSAGVIEGEISATNKVLLGTGAAWMVISILSIIFGPFFEKG